MLQPNLSLNDVSNNNFIPAKAISNTLGGLPLALEQAGAYIEETGSSLSDYLELYHQRRTNLLQWQSPLDLDTEPHKTVTTTWALSFEKVEQANSAAAELLRFFSFLHPDAIQMEIITKGASYLRPIISEIATDLFELNKAIGELRKYSLVSSTSDPKTLSMHRLVQTVLKDGMDTEIKRLWSERLVKIMHLTFSNVGSRNWDHYDYLIPHIQTCAELIGQYTITSSEAANLLNDAGHYLYDRGQYTEAESLLIQALILHQKLDKIDDFDLAHTLNNLAELYRVQGKYTQAIPLGEQALALREKVLGPEHPDVALSFNLLARLHHHQSKYDQAEYFYQRALTIREKVFGLEHPDVAQSLNDLAVLVNDKGRPDQAEQLYQRALAIREKVLGPEHPDVAVSLDNLATTYTNLNKYPQAIVLNKRALAISEKVLGSQHPAVAHSLNNLALIYINQKKYPWAEQLVQVQESSCVMRTKLDRMRV